MLSFFNTIKRATQKNRFNALHWKTRFFSGSAHFTFNFVAGAAIADHGPMGPMGGLWGLWGLWGAGHIPRAPRSQITGPWAGPWAATQTLRFIFLAQLKHIWYARKWGPTVHIILYYFSLFSSFYIIIYIILYYIIIYYLGIFDKITIITIISYYFPW